ncbi:MAG TPA: protein kinase [Thermoanaerobaculia bacterium]|nr:protein kinase [Thermoanaerobaculia bacterium]
MHPETLSHYRVLRLIGAGGMGEVYLAEDTTLNRKAALKLLPARFTQDEERVRRFKREARAASALNHPNIITIYEIGETAGVHFIATEFIEGQTIRERVSHGTMPLSEVIDVGIGVAGALAAAHDAGIIHRDIKPENIMLRPDGYVKVLDFGLAKLVDEASLKDSTTGGVMGTLLYISPEQARGQQPDARSDLYSLGAVMYEMLTGRAPVTGDNFLEMAMSIANRRPDPPSSIASGIPPELDRIVLKALEKSPASRYSSARQLLSDLRALRQELEFENKLHALDVVHGTSSGIGVQPTVPMHFSGTSSSNRFLHIKDVMLSSKAVVAGAIAVAVIAVALLIASRYSGADRIDSVAVLPFVNASRNPSSEYLSDGLSESIIDSLSQLPRLQVMARGTVFRFKGKAFDPVGVGRELHVRGVVSGELAQTGDRVLVHAVLTDVKKGTQVWGQRYERRLADVLDLQRDLAAEISSQLRSQLTGEERAALAKHRAENSEAFQLYLKGRFFATKYNDEEQTRRGIDYYNKAIEADPTYAQAWAGIADAYFNLSNLYMAPREAMPRSREAAQRALALDDSLAAARTSLAMVLAWFDWDFAGGDREFRRAIVLNPNDADAHRNYGDFLTARGQFDHAISEKRRAEVLDPLTTRTSWEVARTLFYAGRLDDAEAQLKRTMELDDRFAYNYYLQAMIAQRKGRDDVAMQLLQHGMQLGGRSQLFVGAEGYTNARLGRRAEALRDADELAARASNAYTVPLLLARIYAALGDKEKALQLLQKVYDDRSESVVWLKVDPTFDSLRGDGRFQGLVKRAGL